MAKQVAENGIDADAISDRLLEAAVAYIVDQVTGEALVEHADSILRDTFAVAETMKVSEVLAPESVQQTALSIIELLNSSALNRQLFEALADALYDLSANDEFRLGEVVDREGVATLIATVLGMHTMFERGLDRFAQSPLVGTVAATFVNRIVAGAADAARTRAEKIPVVKSALSLGDRTVGKMLNAGDRAFGERLGEAGAAAAQYAVKRTNHAILTVIKETPLNEAALEVYDLFANEPVSDLREFIEVEELRALIGATFDLVTTVKNRDYLAELIGDATRILLGYYGDYTVAGLWKEVGVTPELLRDEFVRYAPPVIELAKQDGVLAGLIRRRVAPFFRSDTVREILQSA
ncbi:hypothetical protein [Nocardia inohanensis]|uniref:hypothetical protein n=1 Tax=Nocardia inohanensis TaxID=209246 RepID=UPI0008329B9E|nr:hypothetical protein [Nocardia inohanensis]